MMERIKETANNVLHANENAKRVQKAEERTKCVAMAGGAGVVVTAIVGFVAKQRWKKRYMSLEARVNELEKTLGGIQQCYGCDCDSDSACEEEGGDNSD